MHHLSNNRNLIEGANSGLRQFGNKKPFKRDGECFLFHLKSSFRSQDFNFFVLTFWSCRETASLER